MPATLRKRRPANRPDVKNSGPFTGVNSTTDPFDDKPDELIDAVNMYIPDAGGGSGIYARPGTVLMNSANQLGGSNHMGQCIYHHTALDGTEYNFCAVSGKLYRVSADLLTYTDVTPGTVTVDGSTSTRVFMLSFADMLIVSDGVNRPWMGTNLSSTPITGTNIQYDIGNSVWSAQHMTTYSGALVFAIKTIGGVYHQTRIAWSAPNDPTQGYFNVVGTTAVDYTWDLVQTGTTPIYAIYGTNIALIYWRAYSMGGLSGAIGPDFRNSSTHDAIDFKIGTRAPATIDSVGNTIFFCDTEGRAQMLPLGNRIAPIWMKMRNVVETSATNSPQATQLTAVGCIYPSLNLYVVAIWSPTPSINLSPNIMYVFDSLTGQYVGRWSFGPGINVETIGVLKDQNGQPELVVIGTKVAAINNGFGGYVWRLANVQEGIWTDNGAVPTIQAQTARLGYAADMVRYADKAVAITGSTAPVQITVLSASSLEQGFITDTLTTEAGDPLITEAGNAFTAPFTRASTATQTGITGGITTVGINVLRNANYIAGVLQPPLIEPAATNIVLSSGDIGDNTYWTIAGITRTQNFAVAPDGTTTATRLQSTAACSCKSIPTAVVGSTQYVWSFYAENNGGTLAAYRVFDITHGADIVADGTSYFSQINGATYSRISVPFTTPAGCVSVFVYPISHPAPGTNIDIKVWGGQLELGTVATSYYPTTSVTATRAADIDSMFSATASGYARVSGSFVTEGFSIGTTITPSGFASNPVDTLTNVAATTLTTTNPRSVESAQGGRSIFGGTVGNTIMAEGLQQAIATPSPLSLDGTYRCAYGLDIEGRGFVVLLQPTTATSQWRLHQLQLTSVESMAPPEEA